MPTRQSGTWDCDLVVTEREYRRLIDVISEKLKSFSDEPVDSWFVYTLKNGSITKIDAVDDLFFEDNTSSRAIKSIKYFIKNVQKTYSIELEFSQKDSRYGRSASYEAYGEERDAVFVLASELDERINLLRKPSLMQISIFSRQSYLIFVFIGLILAFGIFGINKFFASTGYDNQVKEFLSKNPQKTVENLFDLVILMQKKRDNFNFDSNGTLIVATVVAMVAIVPAMLAILYDHEAKCYFPMG